MNRHPDDDSASGSPADTRSRAALLGIPSRFEIRRRLGTGGFGSVYAVHDPKTSRDFALKRLERVDAQSIYRFKQEFRLLKGHPHPRLVGLHELFQEADRWCFTMDLLQGVRFDTWVRGADVDGDSGDVTLDTGETGDDLRSDRSDFMASWDLPLTEEDSDDNPRAPFVETRLRESLRQLVEGVLELHSHGILHRDLKPSNVLVDQSGRLVILDFGIATAPEDSEIRQGHPLGTPAYMSPEQALGATLSTASDWYSVGVMLYEALTGHLPYIGTTSDMLRARVSRDPRPPEQLVPNLPADLCSLCMDLLKRDTFERPTGFSIGAQVGVRPSLAASPQHMIGGAFVGRSEELSTLRSAFARACRGHTVVAHVRGESGLGKTTMVQRFANRLVLEGEATVLEGRCFERESVPFKALDDLLDALTRHLTRLPQIEAARLMPRDVQALVRLFPALGRLSFIKDLAGRPASSDLHELRRRAFSALREILARLTDVKPLVLVLDDAHWGDADSADLVRHVLAPPDAPPILLIATYRDDGSNENPLVGALGGHARHGGGAPPFETLDIPISPLGANDAKDLALSLLPEQLRTPERAQLIADESDRSPLFIAELVRAARLRPSAGPELSIKKVVLDRTRSLSDEEHLVLGVLAASERGLSEDDVAQICSMRSADASDILDHLREEQLISVGTKRDKEQFSILHDKVRRALVEGTPENVIRDHHRRLATFFESSGADPETIATHYLAADDEASGFRFTEAAGDAAFKRSAFYQALRNYRVALALASPSDQGRISRKLAPTLGNAGLGVESARTYLQVATLDDDDATALIQRAGEQYLLAGLTDEAMETLSPILVRYGLSAPRTKFWTALSLFWRRRGLRSRVENELRRLTLGARAILSEDLEAVDLSWNLANGFAGIDVFLSVHYNSITLARSLETGEPGRIARALSLYSILRSLEGTRGQLHAEPFLELANHFAHMSESNHALGWVVGARAILALNRSDLSACEELCREAIELLRDGDEPSFREIGTLCVWFWLYPSFLLGKLDQLAKQAPAIAREAEARGDRYTHSTIRSYVLPLHHAVRDQVFEARTEADAGLDPWKDGPWLNQHWAHLHSHCFLDLYEGSGQDLLARTERARPRMKEAFQLMVQAIRIDLLYLEGRGLLDLALFHADPSEHFRALGDKIRLLEHESHGFGDLYARTLEIGALARAEPARAREQFDDLARSYSAHGMPLHARAARLRACELSDHDSVTAVHEAKAALRDLGAINPTRLSWMLIPRVQLSV